jgi:transcription factor E2F7/8
LKTKVRRLYDIANVLHSLGLIEKCHALKSKKPAFKWIGLESARKQIEMLKKINQDYLLNRGENY